MGTSGKMMFQILKLFVIVAMMMGAANAQGISGIPPQFEPIVTFAVGLLSAMLVGPLTAIWKKLGRTKGPTTVMVSAGLSLLIAFGFEMAQAIAAAESFNIINLVVTTFIAFLKANGRYIEQVFVSYHAGGGEADWVSKMQQQLPPDPPTLPEEYYNQ